MLQRRLGSMALGLDTGFRRYDDVGWLGATSKAMTVCKGLPRIEYGAGSARERRSCIEPLVSSLSESLWPCAGHIRG